MRSLNVDSEFEFKCSEKKKQWSLNVDSEFEFKCSEKKKQFTGNIRRTKKNQKLEADT